MLSIPLTLAPALIILIGNLFLTGGYSNREALPLAAAACASACAGIVLWAPYVDKLEKKYFYIPIFTFSLTLAAFILQYFSGKYDLEYILITLLKLAGLGAFFIFSSILATSERRMLIFQISLVLSSGVFALFTLGQFELYSTGQLPIPYYMPHDRLFSALMSPNSASLALGCFVIICSAVYRTVTSRRTSRPVALNMRLPISLSALVGGLLNLIALGLTRSRTGILLTAVLPAILYAASRRKSQRAVMLAVLAFLVAAVVGVAVYTRIGDTSQDLARRMVIYKAHLPSALDSPIGHGAGSFYVLNRRVIKEDNFQELFNIGAMHNVYLQWLEQAGWIGSIPIFACCFYIMFTLFRRISYNHDKSRIWIESAICVALISFFQGMLDMGLEHYSQALLVSTMTGSALGITVRQKMTRRRTETAATSNLEV